MNDTIKKLNIERNFPGNFYQDCAPDGVVSWGWRKVRKGGIVKFDNDYWQHDALIPYIGQYVLVDNDSGYWCTRVRIRTKHDPDLKYLICKIESGG